MITCVLMSEQLWISTTRKCRRSTRLYASCGGIRTEEMVCLLLDQFVKWFFQLIFSLISCQQVTVCFTVMFLLAGIYSPSNTECVHSVNNVQSTVLEYSETFVHRVPKLATPLASNTLNSVWSSRISTKYRILHYLNITYCRE